VTIGVLLMTYGAPRDEGDVAAYLARVRGRDVSPELLDEMRRRYRAIGGSPLVAITRAQAAEVEAALGPEHRVRPAMRFSEPSVADALGELAASGVDRVVALPLSPQWSPTLMSGYERAVAEAAERLAPAMPVTVVRDWHRDPAFVACLAANLNEARASLADRAPAVVLTAHSLPRRVYEAEPEYVAALRETAELVADAAGLDGWTFAYQSAGHTAEEWLRPDLKELFPSLARRGIEDVLVAPVQFVADHLEVLYDLDVAAAEEARAAGLRYHRIAMPNTRPAFIGALAGIVRAA